MHIPKLPLARRAVVARLLAALTGCACLGVAPALSAQAAGATPPRTTGGTTAAPAAESVQTLEKFTVTGSYIPTNETAFTAGTSPVVRIDRKVIDETGLATVSEVLQQVTISNGGSVPISNNATGFTPAATAASLRGLGPDATLVLINGRRVAPYPVGSSGTTAFVDLNSIPLAAVDSIEILKDGASAIYGADAVAGVINIKMKRGLDGTQLMLNYGNTTNKDSSEFTAALITGAQTDKATAMVGFNYYKRNAIYNQDRSYSAIPPFLSSNASPLNLEITPAAAQAAGVTLTAAQAAAPTLFVASPATAANNGATPAAGYRVGTARPSTFNFNEFSMSYPRRDNRGLFAYAERKMFNTDNIKTYVDLTYQRANTENQLAPSATGNFTTAGQVELVIPARTATPLPLPNRTGRAATAGAFNPFNPFNVDITGGTRARLAEFGNRIFRNTTDATLITAGLRGDNIAGKWNFDAAYSFSSVRSTSRDTLVSASRFNRLLNGNDSFFQPGSADYLGTTLPYNPFGYFRNPIPNNQQIVSAALIDRKDDNESKFNQLSAVLSTGNLVDLPAGPVGFALGVDARHEQLDQFPDPFGLTGDLIGESVKAITRAQRKVWGVFGEWSIPVIRNVPGAHDLSVTAAVRHEDFTTHHQTTTVPKVGVRWQPIDESLTLRASWSKGFREPSLYQMFSSPTATLTPITHPLGTFPFEPEQSVTVAGNRRLEPEKTKYLNVGFVWSPQFRGLKGLTLGVDYWDIERTGTVVTNYQDTLNRFFGRVPGGAAGSAPGGLLPGESVVLFPNGSINVVNSVFFNIGDAKIAGFDYSASYAMKTDAIGRFEASTVWTMYSHYRQRAAAGGPFLELVNQDTGESTGGVNGYLRWKGRAQFEWAYKGFTTVIGANYTDGFWDVDLAGNTFFVKDSWIYDGQVSFALPTRFGSWANDTKLAIGGRNLFDRDPPYSAANGGNSTGYPGFLYNSEGRFLYLQVTRKF
jgi:iron complex outermembrane receptor protein